MTASHDSIKQIADIVEEYLVQERYDFISIAARLRQVKGSRSVVTTCERLAHELEARAPER